ncbi:hypothetical protein EYZ11_009556 [Aspergillus tanneri]|uniref:Uncharacterized protein n=1 Tax=Aspergillus tanneri TaxID=1220188 RepID=A0A4S3J9Q5_9EURO|nr:hypothetical protein EYZ11_009556 [Aspergillus tanneri]
MILPGTHPLIAFSDANW